MRSTRGVSFRQPRWPVQLNRSRTHWRHPTFKLRSRGRRTTCDRLPETTAASPPTIGARWHPLHRRNLARSHGREHLGRERSALDPGGELPGGMSPPAQLTCFRPQGSPASHSSLIRQLPVASSSPMTSTIRGFNKRQRWPFRSRSPSVMMGYRWSCACTARL